MRVAVTGGSGFLGRMVCAELEDKGFDYIVVDTSVGLDITDSWSVSSVLKECDHVIHLAGVLGTEELFENPKKAIDVNITGAVNVLSACKSYNVGYTAIQMPFTGWANIYQTTKLAAKNFAECYHKHCGVPVSFVTAYNAFGEGQKVHGVRKIIPTFAAAAWRNQPIPIWGSGEQLVDLIYSQDIARMLVDATKFGNCQNFDAGTTEWFTVTEVADMVIEITGSTAGISYEPMRKGEFEDGIPPVAKGEGWDLLDWKPEFRVSDFEKTVLYYKEDRK